jgi:hypothetical protein
MVSVGKMIANTGMCTGWPPHPKSLADRDASKSTLCIETTFSNFLKLDYPVEQYEKLRLLVGSFLVDSKRSY